MSLAVFDRIPFSSFEQTIRIVVVVKVAILSIISLSLVHQGNGETPSFDFKGAIEEVDTISPPALLQSRKLMEVTTGSSKTVNMTTESKNRSKSDDISSDDSFIHLSDIMKDCGRDDKCPPEDSDMAESTEPEIPSFAIRSRNVDYSKNPYLCRCDVDDCIMYGDCCWNVTIGIPMRMTKNVWRCNIIPEQKKHAMMISECPPKSPSYLTELCEADPEGLVIRNYTYLVDIPVYSKVTHYLYRNIYCARCHGERNAGIHHWKTHLFCSEEMTPKKQEKFIQNAQYFPGKRYFQENNRTCVIYISELINTKQKLEVIVPTIRYCGGSSVETCPDNPHSTTLMSRDSKLCSTYTQHVQTRERKIYKNIHCARCNEVSKPPSHEGVDSNQTSVVTGKGTAPPAPFPRVSCYRHHELPETKFPSPSPPRGPQGISLLFDFALDSLDEALVGYETLCREDEIWDYLHKRCQMAVCQKGHYLQGEACHPLPLAPGNGNPDDDHDHPSFDDGEFSDGSSNTSGGGSSHSSSPSKNGDEPINSTCMRILIFESEYTFISKNNTSIIVSAPNMLQQPIIFHPEEYEYWNETTVAVCAKHLDEGFINRFPSLLNYLSTISVGLSVIFCFLHIIVYLSLPKLQNLPGKTLFCLTVSLFVSQLIFLTLITHSRWQGMCITASITMHYSFLAAFFWMNVMSFDIWRTFSGTMLLSRTQTTERKNITFLKYSLFAWITPVFIVGIAVLVEFFPGSSMSSSSDSHSQQNRNSSMSYYPPSLRNESYFSELMDKIKPSYGKNGLCWFGQRLSLFVFFALPVALVITSNIILFSLSAKAILMQNKEAGKVFHTNESNKTCSKKISTVSRVSTKELSTGGGGNGMEEIKVKLYAKLALIMGLTWIMGFISNFPKMEWLWFPFVVLNGLQGTFIFFAFDCKWKILKMLREKYCHEWSRWKCQWFGFRFRGSREDSSSQGSRQRKQSSSQGDNSLSRSRSTTLSTSYNRTLSTTVDSK